MVRRKPKFQNSLEKENSASKLEPNFDEFIRELQDINQDFLRKKFSQNGFLY